MLEALLLGHEDWVMSVRWHPRTLKDGEEKKMMTKANLSNPNPFVNPGKPHQPNAILTGSIDKSIMVWRPDPHSEVWLNTVRVGITGGHALGIYGVAYGPGGKHLLGVGFSGAFILWANENPESRVGELLQLLLRVN